MPPEANTETTTPAPTVASESQVPPPLGIGDEVSVVHADGHRVRAVIDKLYSNGKMADLTVFVGPGGMSQGRPIRLTSSPLDPTGKKPDSWSRLPAE